MRKGGRLLEAISSSTRRVPVLLFLLFLLAVTAILALSQSAYFAVGNPEVRGLTRLKSEEILAVGGLNAPFNIFRLDLSRVRSRLNAYPPLEDVTIRRQLPNRVIIEVKERRPLGAIPYGRHLMLFDRHGVPFAVQKSQPAPPVPVVAGLKPVPVRLGEPTGSTELALVTQLLLSLSEEVTGEVTQVEVIQSRRLVLSLRSGVRVDFGGREALARKASVMASILAQVKSNGWVVESLDVRTPDDPVVKLRGQVRSGEKNPQ